MPVGWLFYDRAACPRISAAVATPLFRFGQRYPADDTGERCPVKAGPTVTGHPYGVLDTLRPYARRDRNGPVVSRRPREPDRPICAATEADDTDYSPATKY